MQSSAAPRVTSCSPALGAIGQEEREGRNEDRGQEWRAGLSVMFVGSRPWPSNFCHLPAVLLCRCTCRARLSRQSQHVVPLHHEGQGRLQLLVVPAAIHKIVGLQGLPSSTAFCGRASQRHTWAGPLTDVLMRHLHLCCMPLACWPSCQMTCQPDALLNRSI